jgi:hypothetical protein
MSTIRKTPSDRRARATAARTRAEWAWSWIASKAVTPARRQGVLPAHRKHRAQLEGLRRCPLHVACLDVAVMQLFGQPQALTDQAQPPSRLRKQLQILARERPLLARGGQGPVVASYRCSRCAARASSTRR